MNFDVFKEAMFRHSTLALNLMFGTAFSNILNTLTMNRCFLFSWLLPNIPQLYRDVQIAIFSLF